MRAVETKRAADFVEPPLPQARVERMWAGIRGERRAARAPARLWGLAAVAALATLGLGVALARPWATRSPVVAEPEPPAAAARDAWLATGAVGKTYPLGGGSQVELAPETQVRVERAGAQTRLRLERGRVRGDVATGLALPLVVHAGPAEMVARAGAEFDVELEMQPEQGPSLRVGVTRGQVEVREPASGERLALLGAAQSWTNVKLAESTNVAPAAPEPARTLPLPTASGAVSSARVAVAPPGPDAAALLAAAERHRREGDVVAAAEALDQLRLRFPADARAGLAAFELARLRLEQLGDAAGALDAFDAALASGKGGFFVEDAAAGRVRALARLGDGVRCAQARAAFLKTYPASPHAAEVRRLCQAR